ncbi:amine oxidase [Acrocarpospora phusangensis]|uniref:Amine oxidase n=1 Tax=Acrocarpospora phusangensis TaxID=1070424 RepID=A0A919QF89_9ACTN|nr:FAD-dependent oxidoreductase [Acrocarpospora phusangensis]GIH26295.1 amine oxidase [Acrocarpospora phusangensis]
MILGAGLAGLAAAMRLGDHPVLLVEKEDTVGGKARSHRRAGFTFDVTGHWLAFRENTLHDLISGLLGRENLVEIERRAAVWTRGGMVPYPFQANIHGLPWLIRIRCLAGFVWARLRRRRGTPEAEGFENFVVERFGRGMATHFFIPYYTKFWGFSLDELRAEWLSGYFPMPTTAQVLGGALGFRQRRVGYNARFTYPTEGGIDTLPQAMLATCAGRDGFAVRLSTAAEEIDLTRRRIRLGGSPEWHGWRELVSTLPLPDLLDRIVGLPPHVAAARRDLRSIPLRYLNIGLRRPSPLREHWVYTPEAHIPFYRMGVYTNAVPAMAPPGCAGLWVEMADRDGPLDEAAVVKGLMEIGAIAASDDVLFVEQHDIEHAYVVFDDARQAAVDTIVSWLAAHGVHTCGRYGSWTYGSMGDAILDGFAAAARVAAS